MFAFRRSWRRYREALGGEGWEAVPGDLRGAQRHWLRGAIATIDEEAQHHNSIL